MQPPIDHLIWFGFLCGAMAITGCAHGSQARPTAPLRAFECSGSEADRARAFGGALKLEREVDYLQVISHGGGHHDLTVAERGTRCSNATSAAACEAELSRVKEQWLRTHGSCADCRGATLVLTTERDNVAQWTAPKELLSLLGAIDSPADAWLLLMVRDGLPQYACGDASASGYRALSDRIELSRQEWTSTCRPIERVEIVEAFDRAGTAKVISKTVVEREDKGCFVP